MVLTLAEPFCVACFTTWVKSCTEKAWLRMSAPTTILCELASAGASSMGTRASGMLSMAS